MHCIDMEDPEKIPVISDTRDKTQDPNEKKKVAEYS
jgi:hypothetical protein